MIFKITDDITNSGLEGVTAQMEVNIKGLVAGDDLEAIKNKWEEIEVIVKKYGVQPDALVK